MWKFKEPIMEIEYKNIAGGEADSICGNCTKLKDLSTMDFVFEKEKINPSQYDIFIVNGSSMQFSEINDRDAVFVKRLIGGDKYKLEEKTIIALEIDRSKDGSEYVNEQVEFKLRKFIAYIEGCKRFDEWFDELKQDYPELEERRSEIDKDFKRCVEKYKQINTNCDDFQLVFSSKFNVKENMMQYSFHPMKFLYGTVEYVADKNKLLR